MPLRLAQARCQVLTYSGISMCQTALLVVLLVVYVTVEVPTVDGRRAITLGGF